MATALPIHPWGTVVTNPMGWQKYQTDLAVWSRQQVAAPPAVPVAPYAYTPPSLGLLESIDWSKATIVPEGAVTPIREIPPLPPPPQFDLDAANDPAVAQQILQPYITERTDPFGLSTKISINTADAVNAYGDKVVSNALTALQIQDVPQLIAGANQFLQDNRRLQTGEYIAKSEYDALSPEDKSFISKNGIEVFNTQQKTEFAEFESTHVKLPDGYVPKSQWEDDSIFTPKMRDIAMDSGLAALSTEGLSDREMFSKYKEWGIVPELSTFSRIDDEGNIEYTPPAYGDNVESIKKRESAFLSDTWYLKQMALQRAGFEAPEYTPEEKERLEQLGVTLDPESKKVLAATTTPSAFDKLWESLSEQDKLTVLANYQIPSQQWKQFGTAVASFVPIVGTVVDWNRMSTPWKAASIGLDFLFLAPMIGGPARSAIGLISKARIGRAGLYFARGAEAPMMKVIDFIKAENKFVKGLANTLREANMPRDIINKITGVSRTQSKYLEVLDKIDDLGDAIKVRGTMATPEAAASLSKTQAQLTKAIASGESKSYITALQKEIELLQSRMASGGEVRTALTDALKQLEEQKARLAIELDKAGKDFAGLISRKLYPVGSQGIPKAFGGVALPVESPALREVLADFGKRLVKHTEALYQDIKNPVKLTSRQLQELKSQLASIESQIRQSVDTFENPVMRQGLLEQQQRLTTRIFNSELAGRIEAEMGWTAAKGDELAKMAGQIDSLRAEIESAKLGAMLPGASKAEALQAVKNLRLKLVKLVNQYNAERKALVTKAWNYLQTMDIEWPVQEAMGRYRGTTVVKTPPSLSALFSSKAGTATRPSRSIVQGVFGGIPAMPIAAGSTVARLTLIFKDGQMQANLQSPTGETQMVSLAQLQGYANMTPAQIGKATPDVVIQAHAAQTIQAVVNQPLPDIDTDVEVKTAVEINQQFQDAVSQGIATATNIFAEVYGQTGNMAEAETAAQNAAQDAIDTATKSVTETETQTSTETQQEIRTRAMTAVKTLLKQKIKTGKLITVPTPVILPEGEEGAAPQEKYKGAVAWQQGKLNRNGFPTPVWHILNTKGEKVTLYEIHISENPPAGVDVFEGATRALDSLRAKGRLPRELSIDIGAFDLQLRSEGKGKVRGKYTRDRGGRTRGDASAKEANVIISRMLGDFYR